MCVYVSVCMSVYTYMSVCVSVYECVCVGVRVCVCDTTCILISRRHTVCMYVCVFAGARVCRSMPSNFAKSKTPVSNNSERAAYPFFLRSLLFHFLYPSPPYPPDYNEAIIPGNKKRERGPKAANPRR